MKYLSFALPPWMVRDLDRRTASMINEEAERNPAILDEDGDEFIKFAKFLAKEMKHRKWGMIMEDFHPICIN